MCVVDTGPVGPLKGHEDNQNNTRARISLNVALTGGITHSGALTLKRNSQFAVKLMNETTIEQSGVGTLREKSQSKT